MVAGMKKGLTRSGPRSSRTLVFALDDLESADAAADVHADAFGNFRRYLQPRRTHGELARRDGELDEAAHLLDFFLLDKTQGIEAVDFGCDPCGKLRRVELSDGPDTAARGENTFPSVLGGQAQS